MVINHLLNGMILQVIGGIGSRFFTPNEGKDYKWYFFLPIGGLYATDPTF